VKGKRVGGELNVGRRSHEVEYRGKKVYEEKRAHLTCAARKGWGALRRRNKRGGKSTPKSGLRGGLPGAIKETEWTFRGGNKLKRD